MEEQRRFHHLEDEDIVLGVLADTHVPDRVRWLHPNLIPALQQIGVQQILHAGDICTLPVLEKLQEIAPVHAVCGNRDVLFLKNLPAFLRLQFNHVDFGLTHGHGTLKGYMVEKVLMYFKGYHLNRYLPRLRVWFPAARVIIFGHSHRPVNRWVDDRLIFNPGSAGIGRRGFSPSFGIIRVNQAGCVRGEIKFLEDA